MSKVGTEVLRERLPERIYSQREKRRKLPDFLKGAKLVKATPHFTEYEVEDPSYYFPVLRVTPTKLLYKYRRRGHIVIPMPEYGLIGESWAVTDNTIDLLRNVGAPIEIPYGTVYIAPVGLVRKRTAFALLLSHVPNASEVIGQMPVKKINKLAKALPSGSLQGLYRVFLKNKNLIRQLDLNDPAQVRSFFKLATQL